MMGVMNGMKTAATVPATTVKVGVILLASAWFFLCIWALLSLKQPQQDRMDVPAFDDATLVRFVPILRVSYRKNKVPNMCIPKVDLGCHHFPSLHRM